MYTYKKDEDGKLVLDDQGNPVLVDEAGKEVTLPALQQEFGDKIANLSKEAGMHRKGKAEAKAELQGWVDLGLSLEEAKELIEKAQTIDLKDLVKAEEVKAKIAAATDQLTKELKTVKANAETVVKEKDAEIANLKGTVHQLVISNSFATDEFFNDKTKTLMPPDVAEMVFGKFFRVEDGKAVCYPEGFDPISKEPIGAAIYSRERPGEQAGFSEALRLLWEEYPHKDRFLPSTPGDHRPGERPGQQQGQPKDAQQQADDQLAKGDVQGSIKTKLGAYMAGQGPVPAQQ